MAGARKASTIEKLAEALNHYDEDLRPAGMVRFDCEYVVKMVLYAAREYFSALFNLRGGEAVVGLPALAARFPDDRAREDPSFRAARHRV
jgi:hypothetical protein